MKYPIEMIEESLRIGDLSQITTMLIDGEDVNRIVLPHKTDVLIEAMIRNNFSLISLVLSKNFDCRKNQFLYLHHAVRTNRLDFVELIVKHYVDNKISLQECDAKNNNALHIACSDSSWVNNDILLFLTQQGVKWNHKNESGQNPLHSLLRHTLYIEDDLLEYLLKHKKLFNETDSLKISPKDIIHSYSQDEEWSKLKNNQTLIKEMKSE